MWHEARRSEKKVHDLMDATRKSAQRRALYLSKRRGDPQQSIQAVGSRCRLYRDDGLFRATQDQQGLTLSALAKLSKSTSSGGLSKQQGEKKETPQERLKRIMSRQLNKHIKKDTAIEMEKKREQERQRLEKLAETSRSSRYWRRSHSRSYSGSPPRRYRRSRSPSTSRSSRRRYFHSRSRSRSRSISSSCSPRVRSSSRY